MLLINLAPTYFLGTFFAVVSRTSISQAHFSLLGATESLFFILKMYYYMHEGFDPGLLYIFITDGLVEINKR